MTVDDEAMHQHFFYVMENFQKLADKVEEMEQNMAAIMELLIYLTPELEGEEE